MWIQEVDRWARDDLVRKAVEKPIASEAERQEYATRQRSVESGGLSVDRNLDNQLGVCYAQLAATSWATAQAAHVEQQKTRKQRQLVGRTGSE